MRDSLQYLGLTLLAAVRAVLREGGPTRLKTQNIIGYKSMHSIKQPKHTFEKYK